MALKHLLHNIVLKGNIVNDTLSSLRRLIQRKLARYVITIWWEGDTFKHYTMKHNEVFEWIDSYPVNADFRIVTRY